MGDELDYILKKYLKNYKNKNKYYSSNGSYESYYSWNDSSYNQHKVGYEVICDEWGKYYKKRIDEVELTTSEVVEKLISENNADIVSIIDDWSNGRKGTYKYRYRCNVINEVLKDSRIDPTAVNNFVFKWSLKNGYDDVIYYLLNQPEVINLNGIDILFKNAINEKNYTIAEYIASNYDVDPTCSDNLPYIIAMSRSYYSLSNSIINCKKFNPSVNFTGIITHIIENDQQKHFHKIMKYKNLEIDNSVDILGLALIYGRSWSITSLLKNGSALRNMTQLTKTQLINKKLLPTYKPRNIKN